MAIDIKKYIPSWVKRTFSSERLREEKPVLKEQRNTDNTVYYYSFSPLEEAPPGYTVYEKSTLPVIDISEARKGPRRVKSGARNLSMAWDDNSFGLPGYQIREGGTMSERDRKDTYYKSYINNPWVRACVDAIARRFTSGRWEIEELERGKGNPQNKEKIENLLKFVNPDEDFKQFLRSIAVDLGIYGEAFAEIVYKNGVPSELHKIDCMTMQTHFDKHGVVTGYTQSLERSNDKQTFTPEQIIRWWLPDPRASKKSLSPIEGIKDAVYLYNNMIVWSEKFFKQGGKPAFSVKLGEDSSIDDANRYIKWFRENHTGIQNAHTPNILYGGAEIVEFGKGSVEFEYLSGLAWCRDEILAGYNVPLTVIGVQESAHLGGGTGESANKVFIYNTVKPIEQLILEKFNYRVLQHGYDIHDWFVTVTHADYRDDMEIAKVQDLQVRNGTLTINEARQERGRIPVLGGDVAVIVASKDILPVERNADIAEEQREQAEIAIAGAKKAVSGTSNVDPNKLPSNTIKQQLGGVPVPAKVQNGKSTGDNKNESRDSTPHSEPFSETDRTDTAHVAATSYITYQPSQTIPWPYRKVTAFDNTRETFTSSYTLNTSETHDTRDTQQTEKTRNTRKASKAGTHTKSGSTVDTSQESTGTVTFRLKKGKITKVVTPSGSSTPDTSQEDSFQESSGEVIQDASTQNTRSPDEEASYTEDTREENTCEETTPDKGETYRASHDGKKVDGTREEDDTAGEYVACRDIVSVEKELTSDELKKHLKDHWQVSDPDIEQTMKGYQERGVKRLEWVKTNKDACDFCHMNNGQIVPVGQTFYTGALTVPEHNHCTCEIREHYDE